MNFNLRSRLHPVDVPGPAPLAAEEVLNVQNLTIRLASLRGAFNAIDNVSFRVRRGEIAALVGESGSGKSLTALSIMGLLPKRLARVTNGQVWLDGRELLQMRETELRRLRGRDMSMIFQEPMTSLNPVLSIGAQLIEPMREHLGMSQTHALARAEELLDLVGIADAKRRLQQFPHNLSGGMRQRVMIAMALACNPKLIIADEPTTALDVTIQAQVLETLQEVTKRLQVAVVVITHNMGIVARYADTVNVMYAGRIAEQGGAGDVFARSGHPYTAGLLQSVPRLDRPKVGKLHSIEGMPPDLTALKPGCRFAPRCTLRQDLCTQEPPRVDLGREHRAHCHFAARVARDGVPVVTELAPVGKAPDRLQAAPLLQVEGLSKRFATTMRDADGEKVFVQAVKDLSLTVGPGETLGLVGESGCGKTTVGRMIVGLETPSTGAITLGGGMPRHAVQMIFQDPGGSLNPRMTIGKIIMEPLLVHRLEPDRAGAERRMIRLLDEVGLPVYIKDRYPHELSGGQRQRVGIARALAFDPKLIVCDEPVSALDVSIQGQIVTLLEDLQRRTGISYLFIAHDLAVVRHISHRILVMYLGRVMEVADCARLYSDALHPYTQALLDVAPIPDPEVERARPVRTVRGEIPSPLSPPSGCVFHTRCPKATPACRQTVPELREYTPGHYAACINLS